MSMFILAHDLDHETASSAFSILYSRVHYFSFQKEVSFMYVPHTDYYTPAHTIN